LPLSPRFRIGSTGISFGTGAPRGAVSTSLWAPRPSSSVSSGFEWPAAMSRRAASASTSGGAFVTPDANNNTCDCPISRISEGPRSSAGSSPSGGGTPVVSSDDISGAGACDGPVSSRGKGGGEGDGDGAGEGGGCGGNVDGSADDGFGFGIVFATDGVGAFT